MKKIALNALILLGALVVPAKLLADCKCFQFTVEAEAGLRLAIGGYDADGKQTFLEKTSDRETYDGKRVYVIRVDEEIIYSGQVVMWCVQDMKKKWSLPMQYGKEPGGVLCNRSPTDDGKGSFNFVVQ